MNATGGHSWTSVKPRLLLCCLLFLTSAAAGAADVAVVGLFPGKAVLVIDGSGPYTVPVGSSRGPARVVAVDEGGATLDIGGQRLRLAVGAAPLRVDPAASARIAIAPDARGHYFAPGSVNGAPVRFLVDTGATAVTISAEAARRAGIDASRGQPVVVTTANGRVMARRVRLDRVALGTMELHQVDAIVQEGLGDVALLGMTFLNRTDLRREGDRLVLTRRY
jgi:aspartyl protease family protein